MSETVAKLKPLLDALTADERAEVTEYIDSLDDENDGEENLSPEEWEAAWAEEIDRRIDAMDAGETVAIPHEEVMRRMKEKYG